MASEEEEEEEVRKAPKRHSRFHQREIVWQIVLRQTKEGHEKSAETASLSSQDKHIN